MDWQPIETAPKNETVFIAFDGEWIFLCAWWPCKNPAIAHWHRCEGYGDSEPHIMYSGDEDDEDGAEAWRMDPTHWMPFPEPPTK